MEVTEPAERIAVAKPVASRPSCSRSRPFSEQLVGAVQSSPYPSATNTTTATVSEAIVPIKPKTTRLKPSRPQTNPELVSYEIGEESEHADSKESNTVSREDQSINPTVIYKPSAKLISKTTTSQLANLGCMNKAHQVLLTDTSPKVQAQLEVKQQSRSNNPRRKKSRRMETEASNVEPSRTTPRKVETNQKTVPSPSSSCVDRSSYDGYNWRKYGQKKVKGSEFPRSYYKCTYPNCLVKKKVERSFDGQIAEIVYKGEHNHTKPPPFKKQLQSDETDKDGGNISQLVETDMREASLDHRFDFNNEFDNPAFKKYSSGKMPLMPDPIEDAGFHVGDGTLDDFYGLSMDCEEIVGGMDGLDDQIITHKRKCEEREDEEAGSSLPSLQEPRIEVQSSTDAEILEDGFRWRKYGQKVVKGSQYPRSYYRCTNVRCNARKLFERSSDDPRAFVTTYEGKHNHEMTVSRSLNTAASDSDSHPTSKSNP